MRALLPLVVALILLPVSARAADPDHVPWDIQMPLRFGAGATGMWGGAPAFSASLGGVFIGKELFHGVRPQIIIGFDAVRGKDNPVMLIDKDNGKVSMGFTQSLFHLETGFGLHFGPTSGPSGSVSFAPGAVFIDLPGRFKQDPISTVGLGLLWRVEFMPWLMSLHRDKENDEADERPNFGAWVLASISIWASVRADWVEKKEGEFVGGGLGFDLGRLLIAPFVRRFL